MNGPIELRAWPTGLPLGVGDVVNPPLVTTGSTDAGGRFRLRTGATSELWRLADANNGYVNFVMSTPNGGDWHFSRYLGKRRTMTGPRGTDVTWEARPGLPAEPLEIDLPHETTLSSTASEDGAHPRRPYMCGHYEVVRTDRASTKIGEINAESDTVQSDFIYGEGDTADSDISVAIRGRGPWQLSGSHHVGTTRVARVGHEGGSLESIWFASGFEYHLMRDECNREKVIVHRWRGGIENHPQINQGCTIEPYQRYAERYDAGGKFERYENEAVTWTNAAEIFGASLTASSGFSKEVHMQLKFGAAARHVVCGDNDVPISSKRVFSGNSSPV